MFLGESVDRDHISASYESGVLPLAIPVAEEAKPHRVAITHAGDMAGSQQVSSPSEEPAQVTTTRLRRRAVSLHRSGLSDGTVLTTPST